MLFLGGRPVRGAHLSLNSPKHQSIKGIMIIISIPGQTLPDSLNKHDCLPGELLELLGLSSDYLQFHPMLSPFPLPLMLVAFTIPGGSHLRQIGSTSDCSLLWFMFRMGL